MSRRRSSTSGPVRDVITIGERPDGFRVAFKTYRTPVFGSDSSLRDMARGLEKSSGKLKKKPS